MKNNPNSLYKSFFEDHEKEEIKSAIAKSKDEDIAKPPRKKVHTMILEGLIDNFRDIAKKKKEA